VPEKVRVARALDSHLVIQFYEIPTVAEREELARAGITLLDYIPNYAWTAHVRGGAVQSLDPGVVRAVFALRADDKIARSAVGRDVVRAFVYDGVTDAESVLSAYGQVIDRDRNSFTLQLDGDVLGLAAEDIVKYVMGPRPEKIENNDEIRDNINAETRSRMRPTTSAGRASRPACGTTGRRPRTTTTTTAGSRWGTVPR
jgi:hypothetical protein